MLKVIVLSAAAVFTLAAPLWADVNTDTLRVSSPALVVFTCSQTERDSLARDPNSGVDEVLDDFLFYLQKVRPWLDSNRVAVLETTAERFVITRQGKTVYTYDRKADNHIVGCVLIAQGKSPRLISGVSTDYEYRQVFPKYYTAGKQGHSKSH